LFFKISMGTRKDFFEIKIDNLGEGTQKVSPALHYAFRVKSCEMCQYELASMCATSKQSLYCP